MPIVPEKDPNALPEVVVWAMSLLYDKSPSSEDTSRQLFVASQSVSAQPYKFKYFKETKSIVDWAAALSNSGGGSGEIA